MVLPGGEVTLKGGSVHAPCRSSQPQRDARPLWHTAGIPATDYEGKKNKCSREDLLLTLLLIWRTMRHNE